MPISIAQSQFFEAITAFALALVIGLALMRVRWFAKFLLAFLALAGLLLFALFGVKDLSVIFRHILSNILEFNEFSAVGCLAGGLAALLYHTIRQFRI